MNEPAASESPAWQPLTPRGAAAFARAPLARLLLVQAAVAVLCSAAIAWFIHRDWFPVIREAVHQLPAEGAIRGGRLEWPDGAPPRVLAAGGFLAIVVDPAHSGAVREPTDLLLEFGSRDLWICSLGGCRVWAYPAGRDRAFNQPESEPWWGAWGPPWLAVVTAASGIWLIASWACLATLYAGPVWVMLFLARRRMALAECWKLCGAAVLPGALFMSGAIVLYGLGILDLVHLAAASAAHLVLGWVYAAVSPWFVPRIAEGSSARNPFQGS
ncbi:MAG: hypothetical protein U1F98_00170 [Verrucomicrobiota bacterium]